MAGSDETDCEIEYLDEDAEIVQQCVQIPIQSNACLSYGTDQQLLVERGAEKKRSKRKAYYEDDSDYTPIHEPESPKRVKRKAPTQVKRNAKVNNTSTGQNVVKGRLYNPTRIFKNSNTSTLVDDYMMRKKMDIRIPDYDDPLCLPVRALKRSGSDLQRLRNWNNVCLEHFKHCNTMLRPEKGETKSSTRAIVLRNVVHKETGKGFEL